MKRILTGITPTGSPHIGNYFGMFLPAVETQKLDAKRYFFISDQHTFTSKKDPEEFRKNLHNTVLDWLAVGIDPEKSVFYRQSDVRAHTELTWYLNCVCPMGLLQRAHAYKDKTAKGLEPTVGLFDYPILMAADILLYDIDTVPVGKDQKQHVEIARDVAGKFNAIYGEVFVLPEADIKEDIMVIPGLDGDKMSKSYGNTIEIFCDRDTLEKKVMSIVTDSKEMGEKLDPDTCNIIKFHRLFNNPNTPGLEEQYRNGEIGYGESKKQLVDVIRDYFAEARERRKHLEQNPEMVEEILADGARKANEQAEKVLLRARKRMGLGAHADIGVVSGQKQKKVDLPIHFSPAFKEEYPDYVAGAILIENYTYDGNFENKIADLFGQARAKLEERKETEFPEIKAWRGVFSKMGYKPNKYRCAAESLMRRFRTEGTLPNIHPLVDLCNAFSLVFATPCAVFDVTKIEGRIDVKHGTGKEVYETFSGEDEIIEDGEIAFIDDAGNAHSRRWCHRQSGLSAMQSETKEVLIYVEAHHATADTDIDTMLTAITRQLESVGVEFVSTIL